MKTETGSAGSALVYAVTFHPLLQLFPWLPGAPHAPFTSEWRSHFQEELAPDSQDYVDILRQVLSAYGSSVLDYETYMHYLLDEKKRSQFSSIRHVWIDSDDAIKAAALFSCCEAFSSWGNAQFDFAKMDNYVQRIKHDSERWKAFFEEQDIDVIYLTTDELMNDANAVANRLDAELSISSGRVVTARLSNRLVESVEAWCQLYHLLSRYRGEDGKVNLWLGETPPMNVRAVCLGKGERSNIVWEPDQRLPFTDQSIDRIDIDLPLSTLSGADGLRLLRECRRVIQFSGEISLRNSREEDKNLESVSSVVQTAKDAGLAAHEVTVEGGRFGLMNHSDDNIEPLVSVLMTAYKPAYFEEALRSAIDQSYTHLEIIVCDDSPTDEIENLIQPFLAEDSRIRYLRNEEHLGGRKNYLRCFELASGAYLKFLNDDDILDASCVARQLECLRAYPQVTLVTSHRQLIDSEGNYLPGRVYTYRPFRNDTLVNGVSMANQMMRQRTNFIGEPSTVMFRKADLALNEPDIFSIAGQPALANGDMTFWVTLLGRGDAIYLIDTLSYFRIHSEQRQNAKEFTNKAEAAIDQLIESAEKAGFLHEHDDKHMVFRSLIRRDFEVPIVEKAPYLKALEELKVGNPAAALEYLKPLADEFSHSSVLADKLGAAYYQAGLINSALMYLEKAFNLSGRSVETTKTLAEFYVATGFSLAGELLFQGILGQNPWDRESLLMLGLICRERGELKAAMEYYQRLTSLDPADCCLDKVLNEIDRQLAGQMQEEKQIKSGGYEGLVNEGSMATREIANGKVSIIIPVFNLADYTERCLETIYERTNINGQTDWEVIVVDNGSSDGTTELLKRYEEKYDNFRQIRFLENKGFAVACNTGAIEADGSLLLFLNNDTEAKAGWFEPLVETINNDPQLGAVGSKLLFPDGTVQHAGVIIVNHQDHVPLVAMHVNYQMKADDPQVNQARYFQVLTGACLLVRREAFEAVGRFDEAFWNGYEDVDLGFKFGQAGWKLVYEPRSVLTHHESKSGPERFSKVTENVKRLDAKWVGKVKPDFVVNAQGKLESTNAANILPYKRPASAKSDSRKAREVLQPNMVSIIILAFNQLPYTQLCLESIAKNTKYESYEIIVVDNGSTDGTDSYLQKWSVAAPNRKVIRNEKNAGFAAGNNQGIKVAHGGYLLFINNDTIVPEGWLNGLHRAVESDASIGFAGPVTNYISGSQLLKNVPYEDVKDMPAFAADYMEGHRGEYHETERLVGFCLLAKREAIDKTGTFDERYESGNFEDDDLCLRATMAGYRLLIAADVFIHHFGHRSFIGNKIDFGATMAQNQKRFIKKWKHLDQPHELWVKHLLEWAKRQHELGNTAEESWALERAFELAPSHRKIAESYENFLCRQGREGESIDVLNRYLEANPDDADAHNRVGVNLWQTGEHQGGLKHFEKAVSLAGGKIEFMKNLVDAYIFLENFESGIRLLLSLIEQFPSDAEAYEKLATLYLENGQVDDAVYLFDYALTHLPGNGHLETLRALAPEPRAFFAYQLMQAGALAEGKLVLEELVIEVETAPADPLMASDVPDSQVDSAVGHIYQILGKAYEAEGRETQAENCFEKAIKYGLNIEKVRSVMAE